MSDAKLPLIVPVFIDAFILAKFILDIVVHHYNLLNLIIND